MSGREQYLCRLCRKRRVGSREHYFPKWLSLASGGADETIIVGVAVENPSGALAAKWHEERGSALNQVARGILCGECNEASGRTIEKRVSGLLTPLLAKPLPADAESVVRQWTRVDGEALADWCCLRALQLQEILKRNDISPEDASRHYARLDEVVREQPALSLGSETVHIAFAREPLNALAWGSTFIDANLQRVKGPRAFHFSMQMNHLILIYRFLPGTKVTSRFGRIGLCVFPRRGVDAQGVVRDTVPVFPTIMGALKIPTISR